MEAINTDSEGLEKVLKKCLNALDKFAPKKEKYSRENNKLVVNKSLKSSMKRSRHRDRQILKNRSEFNKISYNKQRNLWVSFLRKTKRNHCFDLNEKDDTDNKQFWCTVKPLLSDKIKSSDKGPLADNENIIADAGKTFKF